MARLPYIDIGELEDNDRDLLKRPINLFRQLVNSPGGARAFGTLGGYIRHKSTLDPRLREMAIIQVGYLTKSEYEYTHHVRLGMEQFGVSESDINGITAETNGQTSSLPELERIILRATRDMVTNFKISDSDFENLKIFLSNEHLVDLVLTIAFYCGVVRVLATLEIDNEPHYKEALEKFPLPE
ncbi:carboxymuconolactone decarboxylase family protein [Alphaproteobacteria bacterium]|jgi:alkylhydroperoxidase family enzyme|nr:carboxymuconolactone decarboxylase family protein [Rhodospirillaceae bacterium]MBT6304960.1 carboxymuconolactone decarboxylase family protein [Rhodospirillaceae bacterium]MBT7730969.1 carboxymuconolactone decarboxylase family protein [Rhodospirillaceae bacterium]MDC0999463.1 carboxymuconolactone decarboxylase family protein [Alphaproteobacteria bacterium]